MLINREIGKYFFIRCKQRTSSYYVLTMRAPNEPSYDIESQNTFNQASVHHLQNILTDTKVLQLSEKKKMLLSFLENCVNMLSEGQLLINNRTKILEAVNNFHFLTVDFYLF